MRNIHIYSLILISVVTPVLYAQDLTVLTEIAPSVLTDGSTKSVRVRCHLEGTERDIALDYIKLNFRKMSSTKRELAQVVGTSATITDASLTSRATVGGEIYTTTTSSYLMLTITNASCADVGHYECSIRYTNGSAQQTMQKEEHLMGKSYPTELELVREPMKDSYRVGEEVTLTCSGKVGKPAATWSWRKSRDGIWETYTQGVIKEPAVPVTDCAYHSSTSLTYKIPDDKPHMFRCIAGVNVDDSEEITINEVVSGARSLLFSPVLCLSMLAVTVGFH